MQGVLCYLCLHLMDPIDFVILVEKRLMGLSMILDNGLLVRRDKENPKKNFNSPVKPPPVLPADDVMFTGDVTLQPITGLSVTCHT